MRGNIVTFLLIIIIVTALMALLVIWATSNTTSLFEISEINTVKQEFEDCSDKIVETSRIALSNKCIFSVDRGQIKATNDDITYHIVSSTKVCDKTDWVLINPEKNIWQKCDISGTERVFNLKWNSTAIKFQFEQMGNIEIRGLTGKNIEMSRYNMNNTHIILLLKVY